jgi:hypothetical protein
VAHARLRGAPRAWLVIGLSAAPGRARPRAFVGAAESVESMYPRSLELSRPAKISPPSCVSPCEDCWSSIVTDHLSISKRQESLGSLEDATFVIWLLHSSQPARKHHVHIASVTVVLPRRRKPSPTQLPPAFTAVLPSGLGNFKIKLRILTLLSLSSFSVI